MGRRDQLADEFASMIRFKRATFSLLSPMVGLHIGKNPVSGQRFMHLAPVPFVGLDFELGQHIEGTYLKLDVNGEDIVKAVRESRRRGGSVRY